MTIIELGLLGEMQLKGTRVGRLALAILKAVGDGRPMGWLGFRTILGDICRGFHPDRLRRELRRALYYLLSVTEDDQETEVRKSLQSIQDEFLPVKEEIMTLLEHLEKRGEKRGQRIGQVNTLIRLLSAAFPDFSPADAQRVYQLSNEALDQLTDAIAAGHSWGEIEPLLGELGEDH